MNQIVIDNYICGNVKDTYENYIRTEMFFLKVLKIRLEYFKKMLETFYVY